ncbi:hypothetical protein BGZ70_008100 [Mortierella alpina]|uniref:BZIP domain-containing protein n=1 Tax=Mortierella alpina TaxID=64518 RepID=A0A9P6J4U9_MORAP|nr:hypothetical protein BGZ70_008100 [Mortierella alpina]
MAHSNNNSNNDPSYDSNLLQYLLDQDMTPFNSYSPEPHLPTASAATVPAPPTPSPTASQEASQHPRTKKTASVLAPLLPSTPYSYKQATSRTRTVMPIQPKVAASVAASTATASAITGTPSVSLAAPTATASASTAAPPLDVWVQQFQQLQQMHYQQQHQLLSSTLFSNIMQENSKSSSTVADRSSSAHRGSSSDRSNSPSSSSDKGEHNPIYPSPPIKDNIHMDSDSEDMEIHGSDPLKPSESELKNMTSKERRQLRNKLSARNFRVRRKEYIGTLENQVKEARREAADLQRRLIQSELNCQFLRQELETARFSQSLFTSGHMSKDQANLLASLLNPHTESFPSAGTANNTAAAVPNLVAPLQQPATWSSTTALPTGTTSQSDSNVPVPSTLSNTALAMDLSQPSLQPFVPFDGDWNLFINRVEVPEAMVDPKQDPSSDNVSSNELLARYEAARLEDEVDEQMRRELKAHTERRLAQTYLVMPKDELDATPQQTILQDELVLQTVVYMLMIQLTHSLFEAATLSKLDMVTMFKTMDGPLREKMVEEDWERQKVCGEGLCRFSEWRESWIRKRWPSLFNNRVRLSELSRMSGEAAAAGKNEEMDVVETARKMEEGVAGKTVEVPRVNFFVRYCLPTWAKCPEILEKERLEDEACARARARREEHKGHLESSSKALQALLKVAA